MLTKKGHKKISNPKNDFIYSLSNRISTLANGSIGFCQVLEYEGLKANQHDHIAEIQNASKRIVLLMEDLVALAKIEVGETNACFTHCKVDYLLEQIRYIAFSHAEEKGLEFELNRSCEVPEYVQTDLDKLCRCLENILISTIRLTNSDCIQMNVFAEQRDGKDYIHFEVVDNSRIIDAKRQKMIFNPFIQLDSADDDLFSSPDLRLTTSNYLAKMIGARISVTSSPKDGTVFSVVLPVKQEAKPGKKSGSQQSQQKYILGQDVTNYAS
ncbi:MAG: HAMP domain-containing sensor histidine kinase [Planctomycetota bacterium]